MIPTACEVVIVLPAAFLALHPVLIREIEHLGCRVTAVSSDAQGLKESLARVLPTAEVLIVGTERVDGAFLDSCPRLRLICKHGAGVDNIDLAEASGRGVLVTRAPGMNSTSVAELTVGLMLCLSRRIVQNVSTVRSGLWEPVAGQDLHERTLGLVGVGAIGQAVAVRAVGLGMHVLGFDVAIARGCVNDGPVAYTSFGDVLARADFVSLHVPLTAETRHLIGRPQLCMMRRSAWILNTARGGLVDERALLAALREGRIAGAALDVLELEPPVQNMFAGMDNVLITPHIGGYTSDAARALAERAVSNVRAYLRGEELEDVVHLERRP